MKKIGILGGTFNPIHNGHLMLAKMAYEQFDLDEVLIMPSGVSYMKEGTGVLDSSVRADMVKLAISDCKGFVFDDTEISRKGNTYTYITLQELHRREEAEYFFIVGADTLFMIEKWVETRAVFEQCVLLVSVRDEFDTDDIDAKILDLKTKYNADIRKVVMNAVDISSSGIREAIKNGDSVKGLVPDKVISYIEEKGLYKIG